MKFVTALLFVLIPLCSAADFVIPIEAVKNHVNIRLSPDSASEVVGKLNQGESVLLVDTQEGWYEVALPGDATGYISSDWTEVTQEVPVEAQPPAAEVALDDAIETAAGAVAAAEELIEKSSDEAIKEAVDAVAAETGEEVSEDTLEESVAESTEIVSDTTAVVDVDETEPVAATDRVAETESPKKPQTDSVDVSLKGSKGFLVRFRNEAEGGNSQIYDNGSQVGIGTTEPKQRLEVNGSIQIHEQNSSVAGLMITQSSGDTGYIMHNRASTLTIGAGSQDRITIDRDGNVGFAVTRPNHPLEMVSGAHVTAGGVWTNSSSRANKENVRELTRTEATTTLIELQPVHYNYTVDSAEHHLGFIAEDVPDLVAMQDRKSLSTMDIVAVLTKVVQEQQRRIEALESTLQAR